MSVIGVFGATEHGKSYFVFKTFIPAWKKVIALDPTGSFEGDIFINPDKKKILEIFRKYAMKDSYRIVIRLNADSNEEVIAKNFCLLALMLGEAIGKKVDPKDRVQAIIDEAGDFCHATWLPEPIRKLVKKGRHVNVDSLFIIQDPMAIHNQIRSQMTKIITFYLGNASTVPAFTEKFSKDICKMIMGFPKYFRFEWNVNGEMAVYSPTNQIAKKFEKNTSEFLKKNKMVNHD